MNQQQRITAAKKQYDLDANGNLWTRPRGDKPIQASSVLVSGGGLVYRVEVADIKAALTPKPKAKPKRKRVSK